MVALALHCLMVREGFSVVDETTTADQRRRQSAYTPPLNWQEHGPNEWGFVYSRSDKVNRFAVIINLHPTGSRIFVHASEEHNPHNIQVLGLQLENYVPDASKLKSNSWEGILANDDLLTHNFVTFVTKPLLENSEDVVHTISPRNSPTQALRQQHWNSASGQQDTYGGQMSPYEGSPYNAHYWALTTGLLAAAATATALVLTYKKKGAAY